MELTYLRAVRERKLLTQAELAERAGLRRATVNRLEAGAHGARVSTVRRLADALSVRPEELTGGVAGRAQLAAARVTEAVAALREQIEASGLSPASYSGGAAGSSDPDYPVAAVKEDAAFIYEWLAEAMRVQAIAEAVEADEAEEGEGR